VTVVTSQSFENGHDVDVAVWPGIPTGFRTKEDNRVQPFAVGLRKPFFEFSEYPGRDHGSFLGDQMMTSFYRQPLLPRGVRIVCGSGLGP